MSMYSLAEIAAAIGVDGVNSDRKIDVLLTDSRSLSFPAQTLFFALVTEKGNGHNYVYDLLAKGVRSFVVSQPIEEGWLKDYPDAIFIRVGDTLKALHQVATWKRNQLHIPVIGITGSNGKTILKELLYQLLSSEYRVGRSPKSYNSSIGVPLSLWSIDDRDELAIIEAGISRPMEMTALEQMIQPDWGILTHLGEAHQENFDSIKCKLKEKLKLFERCDKIFAPYDDPLIREELEASSLVGKTLFWSKVDKDVPLFISSVKYHSHFTEVSMMLKGQDMVVELPFLDEGTLQCCYLAILVLSELDHDLSIDVGLYKKLTPISMRLEVVEGMDNTLLINDTYSSDYDSLRIALDFMNRRNSDDDPTALILSDMLESSRNPEELYVRVAELVNQYLIDKIILVGPKLDHFQSLFHANEVLSYMDEAELTEHILLPKLKDHIILLKGARVAKFENIIERLKQRTHQTILNVNLSRLTHNLNQHKAFLPKGTKVICMIKADGYGLGAYEVAKTLQRNEVDYLAVAVVDEGIHLRERGIHTPIIVMNPEISSFEQLIKHELQPEIYSLSLLKSFVNKARDMNSHALPIHLKWDTGMHRLGMKASDIPELLELLKNEDTVRVASIFTHLAAADDPNEDEFTWGQLHQLDYIHGKLAEGLGYSFLKHALNTAGILRFSNYSSDMARIGIGLYGFSPIANEDYGLEPVAELKTVILQIQDVPAGDTVGYGRHGKVDRPSRIGIIPIGYADGISRLLGNGHAHFKLADGSLAPTIGNICMDTIMIDITDAPSVEEGSSVTIFGFDLSLIHLSDASSTIPYETLARLSNRIVRRYYSES
ncbi:bifunctional UDP-N-acetylmuramoyl-tripeptide:D-alanyl-D-alanine ligase/alanine racemase [Porphyromonadaceae bacterium W3.11]|nr:bifunctional UDP-N-acetylmuramoyl-tripeptide:D-alanyl-D-alanine ligase/alanine racemase [Porphyromonadaceae bacterium W3.11]